MTDRHEKKFDQKPGTLKDGLGKPRKLGVKTPEDITRSIATKRGFPGAYIMEPRKLGDIVTEANEQMRPPLERFCPEEDDGDEE